MGICGNQYVPFLTKDFYHTFLKSKNIGKEKSIHKKKPIYPVEILYKASIKLLNCFFLEHNVFKKTFVLLDVYSKAQMKRINI